MPGSALPFPPSPVLTKLWPLHGCRSKSWEQDSSSLEQPLEGAAGLSKWSQGGGRVLTPFCCTRIMSNKLTAGTL